MLRGEHRALRVGGSAPLHTPCATVGRVLGRPATACTTCGNLTRFDVTIDRRRFGRSTTTRSVGSSRWRRPRCCRSGSMRCCAGGAAPGGGRRGCHTPCVASSACRSRCDECVMEGTSACADCVVTFLCDREPGRRGDPRRRRGPRAPVARRRRAWRRAFAIGAEPADAPRPHALVVPEAEELRAAGRRRRGSTWSRSPPPSRSSRFGEPSSSARPRACTAGWRSPTGSPPRSTDPGAALPDAARARRGRPQLPLDRRRSTSIDRPSPGGSLATPGTTTTRTSRPA